VNYSRILDEFLADRRAKESELLASGVFYETHHIIPRSFDGRDNADNLIALTPSDHFFAHLLLAKIYNGKMWFALSLMCHATQYEKTSIRYLISHRKSFALMRTHLSESRVKNNPNAKKIMCVETGEVFTTVLEAASTYNVSPPNITRCLTGETIGTSGGVHWAYCGDTETISKLQNHINNGSLTQKSVLCLETGETFKTAKDAAVHLGGRSPGGINHCLKGRNKSWMGFHWAYANDEKSIKKATQLMQSPRTTAKPVRCVETGVVYPSLINASAALGLKTPSSICNALKKNSVAGGYHWEYA
jgi:hypothetical protein